MAVNAHIQTRTVRRDELKPGDVFASSHGYRLRVIQISDTAPNRTDERHVQIDGWLHAKVHGDRRSERYEAGSTVEVECGLDEFGDAEWAALETADAHVYSGPGTNGYTDVMPRDESHPHMRRMWDEAADYVRDTLYPEPTEDEVRDETARRVSVAQAVLCFGPEYVEARI